MFQIGKCVEIGYGLVVIWPERIKGEMGSDSNEFGFLSWGDKNVLNLIMMIVT